MSSRSGTQGGEPTAPWNSRSPIKRCCQGSEEDTCFSGGVKEVQKFTNRRKAIEKDLGEDTREKSLSWKKD